ncbi:protein ASYMMETRIC LEAVES 2-like [Phragmites australis]|uniref:protein ASYMMETRIC LEAVES 2-like n=1 Tax=Phragmites australis TaxID=29695 RepID=UPI002D796994|nr:protein ASYMMETRIC LEAVES 2-like [Phragmites australis]
MSSSSSPCAACKLLRRKCTQGCVFAPYFPPDNPAKFASVHRVFGASNVSKILTELPQAQREDAINSLAYEADARLRDPVYGCVPYITVLQLRINQTRDELATARKELAGYIGPAAFAPFVAAPQYHHPGAHYGDAAGMGLAVGVAHGHPHPQMVQLQHHQMAEAQQLATAVEVAKEQDMMIRQAAAYAHAPPRSSSGATAAVVPPDAAAYEGGFLFQQQPPPSQAQTAVALTYQMEQEPSPPPSSSGQSHAEEVPQQQHTDGSDEGSGGVVPPASPDGRPHARPPSSTTVS